MTGYGDSKISVDMRTRHTLYINGRKIPDLEVVFLTCAALVSLLQYL